MNQLEQAINQTPTVYRVNLPPPPTNRKMKNLQVHKEELWVMACSGAMAGTKRTATRSTKAPPRALPRVGWLSSRDAVSDGYRHKQHSQAQNCIALANQFSQQPTRYLHLSLSLALWCLKLEYIMKIEEWYLGGGEQGAEPQRAEKRWARVGKKWKSGDLWRQVAVV